MKATEELKNEHKGILLMLDILDAVCRRLESGAEVKPEHLDSIAEFLKVFVDKCHHGKEEDVLFPAMIAAGFPKESGPIAVMLQEHEMGRGCVRRMSEAIGRYKTGDRGAVAEIVRNAREYKNLLVAHIEKENEVLYMMAEQRVPEAKMDAMVEEFETIERDRIGAGKHEEFHRMMKELKGIYHS